MVQIDRLLIVGGGSMGKRHYRMAKELLPNAEIRLLTRYKNSKNSFISIENQIDLEEAIFFKPQATILANPASKHIELANIFSSLGSHLLIEKPVSSATNGVLDLIKFCEINSLVLLCGYNLRFLSSLERFRNIVSNGLIGNVLSVQVSVGQNLESWRPNIDYRSSVSASRELGGGVLLELSHEFDYLRWIFGEIDWVYGFLSKQSQLEIDVEDSAQVIVGFVPSNKGRSLVANISLDFFRYDPIRQCVAVGDRGSLRWNGIEGVIEIWDRDNKKWCIDSQFSSEIEDSYRREWEHFLGCIINCSRPKISGIDGYKVMQIVEAIRLSSQLGTTVKVASTLMEGQ